jgi:hypothetical protein
MSQPFEVQGADGSVIAIRPGDYYFNTKARARRVMLNSLSADGRRVYACLELATMGYRQELAVTMADGKARPLTPGDVAKQTRLSNQNVRRALAELERAGLARRVADDGKDLRHGHIRMYCWAYPRPAEEGTGSSPARLLPGWFPVSWEPFKPLINRFKLSLTPDEAAARDYFEEGTVVARNLQEATEVAARFLERVCARPRLNKEERKGKKVLKERCGPPPPRNDSHTVEPPPAKAEEEVHALSVESSRYARFKAAYPEKRLDEAKAKPIFESLKPAEQDTVLARLPVFQTCERWQQTPRYIPFASNFLKEKQYASDPPPLFTMTGTDEQVLNRKDLEVIGRVQRGVERLKRGGYA